jgi:predicted nucleic acid-binding protein
VIVLDASIVVDMLLRTAGAEHVDRRVWSGGDTLHAPALLDVEVAQVFRRIVSRGSMTANRGQAALVLLAGLPIERHAHEPLLQRIWDLRANLTAYDAAYVSLAEALGVPLLTRDSALAKAPGNRARIELL